MNIKKFLSFVKNGEKFNKKNVLIFAFGIILILFLFISELIPKSNTENSAQTNVISVSGIEISLEERLENLIKSMYGISNVKVSVSIDSTEEYIYAKDCESDISDGENSSDIEYVISSSSDELNGLVVCVKGPRVKGVAVLCSGGDTASVKSEILKLVSSLYSIGTDCIYVGNYKE